MLYQASVDALRSMEKNRTSADLFANPFMKQNQMDSDPFNPYGSTPSIYGNGFSQNNDFFSMMMGLMLQRNSMMGGMGGGCFGGTGKGRNVVGAAAAEIGVGSDSNSGERYGEYGPWCAAFATTMYRKATGQSSTPIGNSHYVPTLVENAKAKGLFAGANDLSAAQPGNFVFFGEDYHHVGIVEGVDADGTVHTIEGNTSDQVKRRSYSAGSGRISGFARVVA